MKKLLFLLITIPSISFAQFSYTCDYTEVCLFNQYTSKFENCKKSKNKTLIVMNADVTMFTITDEREKGAWYIKEYEQGNGDDSGVFIYKARSESGGEVSWMFAYPQKQIVAILKDKGQKYRITYFIKNMF
jgi:hypothetical protein